MRFRILFIAISIMAILLTGTVTVYAFDETDYQEAYEFATAFLDEYYYSAYLFSEHDFSQFIDSPELLNFVNGKVEHMNFYIDAVGPNYVKDYRIEYTLKDAEDISGYIKLTINHVEYIQNKYSDSYGESYEQCQMIIEETETGYVIRDWYTSFYGIDREVRGGEDLIIDDPNYWYNSSDTYSIIEECDAIIADAKANVLIIIGQSEQFSAAIIDVEVPESEAETNAAYTLNKTAMVNWALANCTAFLPSSGNSSVATYVDFSTLGSNSWDCTNFISHALLAGGAVMYAPDNPTGIVTDDSYWFFVSSGVRSRAWSGVGDFFNFIVNNRTKGPYGKTYAYHPADTVVPLYGTGDFIQLYYDNAWKHSTIITGFDSTEDGLVPRITGRSSPDGSRIQNNMSYVDVITEKNATDSRIIRVIGCLN